MGPWLTWALLHLGAAALGTVAARRYALRRRLLDQPGERRSHAVPTPRGGGIAIVAVVLLGGAWLAHAFPAQREWLACFEVGLALVAGIGWADDHHPLSAGSRLAVHALAAGLLAWATWRISGVWWHAPVAFAAALALVNFWNFMDGINGLAASQAAIAAAGLACALPPPWQWLAAGLAAAACGFLPFNFPQARIFLGDAGSGGLGYALAALLSVGLVFFGAPAWPWLLLTVMVFIVDAGFTLAWRMLRREPWWKPHVEHVYQRKAKRWGHAKVAAAYAVLSIVAVATMLAGLRWASDSGAWIALLCYLLAGSLWWRAHATKDEVMHKEIQR